MSIPGQSRFILFSAFPGASRFRGLHWALFFGAFTLMGGFSSHAQDSIVDQEVKVNQQLWFDYNTTSPLAQYRSLTTQYAYRKIFPEVYNRLQIISTVNFHNKRNKGLLHSGKTLLKSIRLGGGVIYTQNNAAKDNLEIRFIQGITFDIPTIKYLTLTNYARIEERFQKTFDDSPWKSGFRFRYRVSSRVSLDGLHLDFTEGFYIPLEAELFINLKKTDRFNDLLRLSPGIGYRFSSDWRVETYLIFNRTKNITETNNTSSDFILRIRLYSPPARKAPDYLPEGAPENN